MESGVVVEYIDHQRITCAVILEIKNKRLRLLTESNREVNLSESRLSHCGKVRLDVSQGREKIVEALKKIASRREQLISRVNVRELWEVLSSEREWIDLATMTEFCFPGNPSQDHESAVVRAFFKNRLYFKFYPDRFFPYSEEQVDHLAAQRREQARRTRVIHQGAEWLKQVNTDAKGMNNYPPEDQAEIIEILQSIYLMGRESEHFALGKEMLSRAGIKQIDDVFALLVKIGKWREDENLDLILLDIPTEFPKHVDQYAQKLVQNAATYVAMDHLRTDLTDLPIITIDGQATLDYDDGLSVERFGDRLRLGIHIADVGQFIGKGDPIDQEAINRGSSIYMPDQKIPMLPACLAEDLCSLKAGARRPALSVMVWLDKSFDIQSFDVLPSWVRVQHNHSYFDVNAYAADDPTILHLRHIAEKFRQKRLDNAAVQITLPEINVWIDDSGNVSANHVNRESPSRMLVSELMIMANWLMAKFLVQKNLATVFRSQPEPKDRLYQRNEGTLFQNWMQRKLLNRFILDSKPADHSGLGLDTYVTATSPIRKYFDLITQRQIRAALGLEPAYSRVEIDHIIQVMQRPMRNVAQIQFRRHRYWILKYLETQIGQKAEAIVLIKRRNSYRVLLPDVMVECDMAINSGPELKPEDLVQVTYQRVSARKDEIVLQIG